MEQETDVLYTKIGKMLMDLETLVTDRQNLLKQIETLNERIKELESPAPVDLRDAKDEDADV